MMRVSLLGSRYVCLLFVCGLPQSPEMLNADVGIDYVGRGSCASATCHGGVVGQGPTWNSSLSAWEAHDTAHAGAGTLLSNQQSRDIAVRLLRNKTSSDSHAAGLLSEPSSLLGEKGVLAEAAIVSLLKERCVSCHAPMAKTSEISWQYGLQEGVSCEACHGPASKWLTLHTLKEPSTSELAASGKIATKNWNERTDNCTRCHVGSRSADGMIRDMNHDMIAAGHPGLWFDMSQYHLQLPAHWQLLANEALVKNSTQHEIASHVEYFESKQQTLLAAARLSLERQQANKANLAPFPELAEYDCFACHQSVALTRRLNNEADGIAWNPFHTLQPLHDAFPLGDPKFTAGLNQVIESVWQDRLAELSLRDAIRWAAGRSIELSSGPNSQLALNWLSSNEVMLLNTRLQANDQKSTGGVFSKEDYNSLSMLLHRYRSQLDSPKQTAGSTFVESLPAHRDFAELMLIRKDYIKRISTIISPTTPPPVVGSKP